MFRWEPLERRTLFHGAGQDLPGGLTIEQINALPDSSPIPFDLHLTDDPVGALPADAVPPPAPVTTIRNSGPPGNRVDIVLVGDGYTSAQLSTYAANAQSFLTGFFNEAPFDRYANYFNVHRVDVTSTDSGVDNDPTQGITKNTALDMGFFCSGIERLLCVNTTKAKSYAANAPQVDQVIAIANSTKYGGAGYPSSDVGTYSGGNGSSLEIAKHEFGHSFGDLADEYDYADGTTYTGPEPVEADVSIYNAAALATGSRKWFRWLDLPNVDTFEGAYYAQFGIFRPTVNSKMRNLGRPFEEVNAEQLILKLYQTVRPIDSATASGTYQTETSSFVVDPVDPVGTPLAVQWYLDNVPISGATGLTFAPSSLGISGNHTLQVVVQDTTSAVRDEAARASLLTDSRTWTLIDTLPPTVASSSFNFDSAPMSIAMAFSESLGNSLQAGDLTLFNQTTGEFVDPSALAVSYVAGINPASFTFPGYVGGILPDGNYQATLPAGSVQDSAANTLASDFTYEFFVLSGDANRDKSVDTVDFNILASNFSQSGKLFSEGDFNYDGTVDSVDFDLLASKFGKTLAAPASTPAADFGELSRAARPDPVVQRPAWFSAVAILAPSLPTDARDNDLPALL